MKKVILKIFLMMGSSMLFVTVFSRVALLILGKYNKATPSLSYHISLLSGFLGLCLFALLLYLFLGKKLKKISDAVKTVSEGDLNVRLNLSGHDELTELSENFNRMTQGLSANERFSREFVRNVSHEFKTPVANILGYADLLESEQISEKERQNYTKIIRDQAKRLSDLSVKLLQISRVDSDLILNLTEHFQVDEQIRKIILSMQPVWEKKNLSVNAELEKLTVSTSEQFCYLIWQNLISNAVKYTPDNGRIDIRLYRDKNLLIFEAENTARISPENEKLIFQPFFSTDESKTEKGAGLGLPLVQKIAEKLSGDIFLSCGETTLFRVSIPVLFQEC